MLREFTDDDGVAWRVWDVNPSLHGSYSPSTQKLSAGVPAGWLCFESHSERRRLSPIPDSWENLEPDDLKRMCAEAERVRQLHS